MACSVCGSPNTVRSHIIPRALIHDSKEGEQAVAYGERGEAGHRLRQSGKFDQNILCEEHERITGDIDRYGVDFVRVLNIAGQSAKGSSAVYVPNSNPKLLVRFALSVIWREIHSGHGVKRGLTLGTASDRICQAIFKDGDVSAPTIVSYQQFTGERNERVPVGIHPFRVRMFDRIFWQFTVVGCGIWICTDGRGLPAKFDGVRADLNDPVRAAVGDPRSLSDVGILQGIFRDMRSRR